MPDRIACFGDVHGNIDGLKELYAKLEHESLDAIYHLGDLIDRGPDPAGVIQFLMEKKIGGVAGNHDSALLKKHILEAKPPKSKDKLRSYQAILGTSGAVQYLQSLSKILVFEELGTILVHAGVDPLKPLTAQNSMCCYVSMVNPSEPGSSRWCGIDRKGNSESVNREKGWRMWYELYNLPYNVYHGHLAVSDPRIEAFPLRPDRKRVMLDTGAWFTGMLSAAIIKDSSGPEKFVSTTKIRCGKSGDGYEKQIVE